MMENVSSKIKLNDQVEVIAGKDKGRVSKVIKVLQSENKLLVEKVNVIKRHTKPNNTNQQGGIIEKEASLHISNLMIICNKCAEPTRIGKRILDDGSRVRVCKKCSEILDE